MYYTGLVLICSCGAVSAVYETLIRRVAWLDSTQEGLLCWFVPFYEIYYIVKNWKYCGKYCMISLICLGGVGGGIAMLLSAPSFHVDPTKPKQGFLNPPAEVRLASAADFPGSLWPGLQSRSEESSSERSCLT